VVESEQSECGSRKISQRQDGQATPIKDSLNYRRHRGACPFYRENWSCESEPNASSGQLLYQIICLMDTPPVTPEEQHKCLHSPHHCWRFDAYARRNGHMEQAAESEKVDCAEAGEAHQPT
jgi:hypothetical protein